MVLNADFISRQLQEAYQPDSEPLDESGGIIPGHVVLKCAAVLLPLVHWQDEWHLVFTRRTDRVEHHKGQVSFPGGGCNSTESTPEQTALREAREEIGLVGEDVSILGRMNDLITITRFRVTPVIGVIPWPYPARLETAEVERVFTIPLLWLSDRAHWAEQLVTLANFHQPVQVIRYQDYDGEILWGISARITQDFLRIIKLLE